MMAIRRDAALLALGDLFLFMCSLWLALGLRSGKVPDTGYFLLHLQVFIFVFLASLLVFFVAGLYEKKARLVKRVIGIRVLGAQVATTLLAALAFFLLPLPIAPKTNLGLYLLISVLVISTWRFFVVPRLTAGNRTKAVLLGAGSEASELWGEIKGNPKYSIELMLQVDPEQETDIVRAAESAYAAGAALMIVDTKDERIRGVLPELYTSLFAKVPFIEFSDFYEDVFDRVSLSHLGESWLIENPPERHAAYDIAKRTFDMLGALLGLAIALCFIIPAVCAIRLSGGAAFIYHQRIGRAGKPFNIIKLRTMLLDDHGDPDLRARNRVTRLGAFLRKTRIDELPQLVNVLKGDLSFIGPRPELPQLVKIYEREIPYYGVRHLVTPGLSGWAQLYHADAPRGGADVPRTRMKLSYDLYYLKHHSFGLDLAVALKTIRALLSFSGT